VQSRDVVFADDDGCLFVASQRVEELLTAAREIRRKERDQADAIRDGRSLREQLQFAGYLEHRAANPAYSFREHLRKLSGAVEEYVPLYPRHAERAFEKYFPPASPVLDQVHRRSATRPGFGSACSGSYQLPLLKMTVFRIDLTQQSNSLDT
jgi:hypothetical protein